MSLKQLDDDIYKHTGGLWFRTIIYSEDRLGESLKLALLRLRMMYLRDMKEQLVKKL